MAEILNMYGERRQLNDLSLESLQQAIGAPIEVVSLPDGHKLLVNEDGRSKGLPYNTLASALADQPVVGDAVLCTSAEWESSDQAKPTPTASAEVEPAERPGRPEWYQGAGELAACSACGHTRGDHAYGDGACPTEFNISRSRGQYFKPHGAAHPAPAKAAPASPLQLPCRIMRQDCGDYSAPCITWADGDWIEDNFDDDVRAAIVHACNAHPGLVAERDVAVAEGHQLIEQMGACLVAAEGDDTKPHPKPGERWHSILYDATVALRTRLETAEARCAELGAADERVRGLEAERDEWRQSYYDRCAKNEKQQRQHEEDLAWKQRAETAEARCAELGAERDRAQTEVRGTLAVVTEYTGYILKLEADLANLRPPAAVPDDGLCESLRMMADVEERLTTYGGAAQELHERNCTVLRMAAERLATTPQPTVEPERAVVVDVVVERQSVERQGVTGGRDATRGEK